jgi:hypothetical protein
MASFNSEEVSLISGVAVVGKEVEEDPGAALVGGAVVGGALLDGALLGTLPLAASEIGCAGGRPGTDVTAGLAEGCCPCATSPETKSKNKPNANRLPLRARPNLPNAIPSLE